MLKYKADRLSIAWLVVATLVFALSVSAFNSLAPLEIFAVTFVNGFLSFMAGVVNHNHGHNSLFRGRSLNRVVDFWLSWLMGASSCQINFTHIKNHHRHYSTEEDWTYPGQVTARAPLLMLLQNISMSTKRIFKNRESALHQFPKTRKKIQYERRFLQLYALCALLFFPIPFVLFQVLPWIIGLSGMLTVNYLQHVAVDGDEIAVDFTNAFENAIFLNNGFHSTHHIDMHLHWTRLPENHDTRTANVQGSLLVFILQFLLKPAAKVLPPRGQALTPHS